jgi:hypothetical protein
MMLGGPDNSAWLTLYTLSATMMARSRSSESCRGVLLTSCPPPEVGLSRALAIPAGFQSPVSPIGTERIAGVAAAVSAEAQSRSCFKLIPVPPLMVAFFPISQYSVLHPKVSPLSFTRGCFLAQVHANRIIYSNEIRCTLTPDYLQHGKLFCSWPTEKQPSLLKEPKIQASPSFRSKSCLIGPIIPTQRDKTPCVPDRWHATCLLTRSIHQGRETTRFID